MDTAWEEYLAATRRLDAVRRTAAAAVGEQEATVRAARDQVAYVRQRLALQEREWPRSGVPAAELAPAQAGTDGPPPVGGSPAEALNALHHARSMVDQADTLVMGSPSPLGTVARLSPAMRNLLVYGAYAFLVLITQLVLLSIVSEAPFYLPLCGLVLPAAAFGLGYVTIGVVFPAPPGGTVDRTPILGAVVCLATVVVLCAGLGLLAVFR